MCKDNDVCSRPGKLINEENKHYSFSKKLDFTSNILVNSIPISLKESDLDRLTPACPSENLMANHNCTC